AEHGIRGFHVTGVQTCALPISSLSTEAKSDYNFGVGIVVAIVSGVLSACFNFGIEAGKPMAEVAYDLWKAANPNQGEFLYQNNVTYIVILWGGFATNFI